ncbi:MAG: hypothetical protein JNL90_19610 [Planctomycetes bacterium]|nr:hypothetical protein [Planctomycetota bacterium]
MGMLRLLFATITAAVVSAAPLDAAPLPAQSAAPLDAAQAAEREALLARLPTHPYFQRVELAACSDFAPTLWLVQRPANAKPGFERDFAALCEPWVAAARALLRDELGAALPAARRPGRALDTLVVLASEGDFGNYWKLCGTPDSSGMNHWNGELDVGVVKRDIFETPDDARDRAEALYVLGRSLLDGLAQGDPAAPGRELWVREGLSFALAGHDGDAQAARVATLRTGTLRWYVARLLDAEQRALAWLPIEELLRVADWNGLLALQSKRTGATIDASSDAAVEVRYAFLAESSLFVHWLLREEGGKLRPLLVERLAALLGTREKLKAAPVAVDAAALQAGFAQFLARAAKGSLEKELQLSPELAAALAKGDGGSASAARSGAAGAAERGRSGGDANASGFTSKLLDPAFEPALLLEEPLPPEARLGMALRRAGDGDLDGAKGALEALRAELPAGDPLAQRAQRDVERLVELSAARREFLLAAKGDKRKLKFDHDGAARSGTAQEVEGDVLLLSGAKGVVERVPLAAIGCEELLRTMSEWKRETGSATARAFAALLAGRKAWAKGIAGATPPEVALRDDGAQAAALLKSGAAAALIESLARAPRPATVAHGEAALEQVRALLTQHRSEPLVLARLPALRTLAAFAAAPLFEARGLPGLGLAGKVESLGEGRLRVTWDFEDAKQAQDFEPAPVRVELHGSYALQYPIADSYLKVEKGALRMRGKAAWRCKVAFAAPLTCRYQFSYVEPKPYIENCRCSVSILVCDDGGKRLINTLDMAGVEARDGAKFESDNDATRTDWDVAYDVTLTHDGKQATLRCEGFPQRQVPVGTRQSGQFGVMTYSDVEVTLDLLVLEASLDPTELARRREAWLEQELAALFDGKPAKR